MKKCKRCSDMTLIGSKKIGCELVCLNECYLYSETFEKRGIHEVKTKQNHKTSEINLCISVSVFAAGISMNKIDDFFTSVGLIAPVKSKLHENYQKLKPFTMDLSKLELIKQRIENYSAVRLMKVHSGNLKFETNNVQHSCYRGSIAIDGAGSARAYDYRVRGDQNCLILLSLDTKKPLLVVSHQISHIKCSMRSTAMMKEQNMKINDLKCATMSHEGKLCKNTNMPTASEEQACIGASSLLLMKN